MPLVLGAYEYYFLLVETGHEHIGDHPGNLLLFKAGTLVGELFLSIRTVLNVTDLETALPGQGCQVWTDAGQDLVSEQVVDIVDIGGVEHPCQEYPIFHLLHQGAC